MGGNKLFTLLAIVVGIIYFYNKYRNTKKYKK